MKVCKAVFRLDPLCYSEDCVLGKVVLDLPADVEELLGCPSSESVRCQHQVKEHSPYGKFSCVCKRQDWNSCLGNTG